MKIMVGGIVILLGIVAEECFVRRKFLKFAKRDDSILKETSDCCKKRNKILVEQYEKAAPNGILPNGTELQITSHDGFRLQGKLYRKDEKKQPKAVVVAVHGYHSGGMRDMAQFARMYQRAACDYLIISQRCHEDSDGEYITFGKEEAGDCLKWCNRITEIYREKFKIRIPIVLHGLSMGGATVLLAAAYRDNQLNIRLCIADSAYDNLRRQTEYFLRRFPLGIRQCIVKRIDQTAKKICGHKISECAPDQYMNRIKVPVILIHGKEDHFVLPISAENLYKAYREDTDMSQGRKCRLYYIEKAGHMESYAINPELYEKIFISSIDEVIN